MSLPLAQSQLDAITAACQRHHVARLHDFGSVLRPDYRPGESDIDLLVEFQALEPGELALAYFGLEQQLERIIGPEVDLVMAAALRNPNRCSGDEPFRSVMRSGWAGRGVRLLQQTDGVAAAQSHQRSDWGNPRAAPA